MSDNTSTRTILAAASSPFRVVDFYDVDTGEHLGKTPKLLAEPHELAVDQERGLLYLSHTYRSGGYMSGMEPGHEVSVIDVARRDVIDVVDVHPYISPHDVEYSRVNDAIYASVEANDAGHGIVEIDAHTRTVTGLIETAGRNSHWFAVTPDGHRGFASHKEGQMISVLDLHTRTLIGEIEMPGGAEEVDVSPDGRWLYAVTPQQTPPAPPIDGPSTLLKIDTETCEIVGELELEPTVVTLRAADDGRVLISQMYQGAGDEVAKLYSGRGDTLAPGRVFVVDGVAMEMLAAVELDRMAFTIRVAPGSAEAYISNLGAGTVSVVDLGSYTVTRSLDCTPDRFFGGTHGLGLIQSV